MEIVCGVQGVYCRDSIVFWGHREFIYEKKGEKNVEIQPQKKLIESTIKKEKKSFPCTKKNILNFYYKGVSI